jgi:hypothetical protein
MRKRAVVALLGLVCTMALQGNSAAQWAGPASSSAPTLFAEETDRMTQVHRAQAIPYTHALRITFAYENSQLQITSVTRIAMRVPAPSTLAPQEGQVGSWFEVRDGKGTLLYYRPLHDPMRLDTEIFGDKPGDPLRHVPARDAKGEFEVLAPDLPDAEQLRLYGPRTSQKEGLPRSTVLSEHRFDELRKVAQQSPGNRGPQPQRGTP